MKSLAECLILNFIDVGLFGKGNKYFILRIIYTKDSHTSVFEADWFQDSLQIPKSGVAKAP